MLPFILILSIPLLVPAAPLAADSPAIARSVPFPFGKNQHQSYANVDRNEESYHKDSRYPPARVEQKPEGQTKVERQRPQKKPQTKPSPSPNPKAKPQSKPHSQAAPDSRSQHRDDFKQDAFSEGNSVVLFNGKPVEIDHKPVKPEDLEQPSEEGGVRRRDLAEKLGIDFMYDKDVDEDTLANVFQTPNMGFGNNQKEIAKDGEAEVEPVRRKPTRKEEEEPIGETVESYNGNKFTFYNGKPVNIDRRLARRDVRELFNLPMFTGAPGKKKAAVAPGKKKSAAASAKKKSAAKPSDASAPSPSAPAPAPEKGEKVEEKPEVNTEAKSKDTGPAGKTPDEKHAEIDDEEISMDQLKGKSFVLYNGKPVEINGKPVATNKRVKKTGPFDFSKPFGKRYLGGLTDQVTG